jgi:hypothetical protein
MAVDEHPGEPVIAHLDCVLVELYGSDTISKLGMREHHTSRLLVRLSLGATGAFGCSPDAVEISIGATAARFSEPRWIKLHKRILAAEISMIGPLVDDQMGASQSNRLPMASPGSFMKR